MDERKWNLVTFVAGLMSSALVLFGISFIELSDGSEVQRVSGILILVGLVFLVVVSIIEDKFYLVSIISGIIVQSGLIFVLTLYRIQIETSHLFLLALGWFFLMLIMGRLMKERVTEP